MTETNLLTGIRDLDREIVNKMSDRDFLQMCGVNRTYSQRVCDETYFRIRTEKRFPETVPYKDYVNENEGKRTRTWKNHYLNIVKYIDLLEKNYRYIYKKLDKSPELLYLARQSVPNYMQYTKVESLINASKNGILPVVKYLTENGANIHDGDNEALRFASANDHLPVVEYLVENGADLTAVDNQAVRSASKYGYLEIVKYLVEHGADITVQNNIALKWARNKKHVKVAEYLESLQ